MRALICGGESIFGGAALNRVREIMNRIHAERHLSSIVCEPGRGAPTLATVWAAGKRVPAYTSSLHEALESGSIGLIILFPTETEAKKLIEKSKIPMTEISDILITY